MTSCTSSPMLLSLAGVAHELSVSPRHARRLLAAGRLPRPACNVSLTNNVKGLRWSRDELLAVLLAGRQERICENA